MTSSNTPRMLPNSWETPSICTANTVVPRIEESMMRRKE